MDNLCDNCGFIIEGRINIYGTYCPKCETLVKPSSEPLFIVKSKYKLLELRSLFLAKLKRDYFNNRKETDNGY